MVDQARFKKKSLGAPPAIPEGLSMLEEPEVAPSAPMVAPEPPQAVASEAERPSAAPKVEPERPHRIDGRSIRKTGRTTQISTRITESSRDMIYRLAEKHGLLVAEVIEQGAELLRAKLSRK